MLHYKLFLDKPYLKGGEFDYLSSPLPPHLREFFGDQIDRSRPLLAGRSPAEFDYALDSLDWMLHKGGELLFYEAIKVAKEKGHCALSRVKAMKQLVPRTDISEQPELPDVTWADYFAVLSIAFIGEVLTDQDFRAQPAVRPSHAAGGAIHGDLLWDEVVIRNALESMEAVSYAEQLQGEARLLRELESEKPSAKQLAKTRGRKGGKMRAAKYSALKSRVISLYHNRHSDLSNRQAAKTILERELTDKERGVLETQDPHIRLEKWIGEFKRDQPVPNPSENAESKSDATD